ncbi:MAG: hypothetical protein O3A84_14800 [Proteobacteria bacterium]|nr:hypothetical protein [Pseudomonadota bacterium]
MSNMPSPTELVSRAAGLVPELRKLAGETEANRHVPGSSVKSMVDAGLFNVCKTLDFGGYEMGWDALCDIAMTLAAGCPSTAWVFADWFFCGMVGEGGMKGAFLIPKSDVSVLDTWHVMGLAGTGTHPPQAR